MFNLETSSHGEVVNAIVLIAGGNIKFDNGAHSGWHLLAMTNECNSDQRKIVIHRVL